MKTILNRSLFTIRWLGIILLGLTAVAQLPAAQIVKGDGSVVEGTIRGTVVLRDLRHVTEGGEGWGLLYYVVPGAMITRIDGNGVHWTDGKDVMMHVYVLGKDPKDDLRGLSPEFTVSWGFTLAYQGGNSSSTKGPPSVNPIPLAVYGELSFEKDEPKVAREIVVETGGGPVSIPVAGLAPVAPKPKVEAGKSG